jgi:hypothetical protein
VVFRKVHGTGEKFGEGVLIAACSFGRCDVRLRADQCPVEVSAMNFSDLAEEDALCPAVAFPERVRFVHVREND